MLLSRAWYVALAVALSVSLFFLFLAQTVSNRTSTRDASKLLTAASKAVRFYMSDDARQRAAELVPLALDGDVRKGLSQSSKKDRLADVDDDVRSKVRTALRTFREKEGSGPKFDILWAVDIHGRVLANDNYERGTGNEGFEMGGYAVVADALHGWIRDDSWIFDNQVLRVVARPVETRVGGTPVGAIIGAKVIDDGYAQSISNSTGAAVAFYANATRVATGAPPEFNKALLEVTTKDIGEVAQDENYQEKGRTAPRDLRKTEGFEVTAIFARLPGDAWDLGAGYVVGHRQAKVTSPLEFQRLAVEEDKEQVPLTAIVLLGIALALGGFLLSLFEHTLPLRKFKKKVEELADKKSDVDVLKPSTFFGTYKSIAASINDALDIVAAKSGVDRGPADLESVLGPMDDKPQMSAFSVPGADGAESSALTPPSSSRDSRPRSVPKPKKALPKPPSRPGLDTPPSEEEQDDAVPSVDESVMKPPAAKRPKPPAPSSPGADAPEGEEEEYDEEAEWKGVYEDFKALKEELGESTEKLTFEKFRGTLQRNKEALIARHDCERVKFRVYEKQGKAALKASPVKS